MEHPAGGHHGRAAEPCGVATTARAPHYELFYPSLFDAGCSYAFPCDACGQVALDELSERARRNYLFARAVTGSQLGWPSVVRRA